MSEKTFTRFLCLERRRAERSRKHLILMLVVVSELSFKESSEKDAALNKILHALLASTRETDITGWYDDRLVIGTILTEVPPENLSSAVNSVFTKVNAALLNVLNLNQINNLHFTFHAFPEPSHNGISSSTGADLKLYPDVLDREASTRIARILKRSIDFGGSLILLALLSPFMAMIAVAIKLTSRGPVFFRQQRLGQYGRPFSFLKFRSMHVNSDASVHREYVERFITGTAGRNPVGANGSSVFKLTNDPRVTPIGRFLRKTSLDELPQFFNVLSGRMSLVGPRPPIPYEFIRYGAWHRRRLLEAKPGITGLWQVSGRSRTKFDEMVRLDLQYAKSWSLWLDFKILLQTPRAVWSGEGAY